MARPSWVCGRIHQLKTWPEFFQAVNEPNPLLRKNFEYRLNDRDFQVGDTLILQEYDPVTQSYTGQETARRVTYILPLDQPFSTSRYATYVIMSLCEVNYPPSASMMTEPVTLGCSEGEDDG